MRERDENFSIPEFNLTELQRRALRYALGWTKEFFDKVPPGTHIGGHGFDKTERQVGVSAYLAAQEGHPVFLPVLTAMIMDVGRATQDPRSKTWEHGQLSKELVTSLLSSIEVLTEGEKELVANAVEDHPKKNENVRRNYVVEIAMDADRLDCLGFLGPLRAASWRPNVPLILPEETNTMSGDTEIKTVWQDMVYRQLGWFDMLWTKSAREFAEPRVAAYRAYLEELRQQAGFMYQAFKNLGL